MTEKEFYEADLADCLRAFKYHYVLSLPELGVIMDRNASTVSRLLSGEIDIDIKKHIKPILDRANISLSNFINKSY